MQNDFYKDNFCGAVRRKGDEEAAGSRKLVNTPAGEDVYSMRAEIFCVCAKYPYLCRYDTKGRHRAARGAGGGGQLDTHHRRTLFLAAYKHGRAGRGGGRGGAPYGAHLRRPEFQIRRKAGRGACRRTRRRALGARRHCQPDGHRPCRRPASQH